MKQFNVKKAVVALLCLNSSLVTATKTSVSLNALQKQMKNALLQETDAEAEALKAEQLVQSTTESEKPKAKRALFAARQQLQVADRKLDEVQKLIALASQKDLNQEDKAYASDSDQDSSAEDSDQEEYQHSETEDMGLQSKVARKQLTGYFKKSQLYNHLMQEAKDEVKLREENEKTIAEIRETKRAMKQLQRQYDWLVQRTKQLQITPYKQDGLVPPPRDPQYQSYYTPEGPNRKPLIWENRRDSDDIRNVYNPNKYQNHIGNYGVRNGGYYAEISPQNPSDLVPAPKDSQYDFNTAVPLRKPLIFQDSFESSDLIHRYNPEKYGNHIGNYAQTEVNPAAPDGLVMPPKDPQYDAVVTPNNPDRKPIIHEDRHDKNDVRNVYNADKYNNHIGNYAQVNPAAPDGLVMPPKDPQYDAVVTPNNPDRKPIIHEDRHDKNDVRNVYNADKYNNHIGNYAQVNPAAPDGLVMPPKDPQYDAVVTPNNPDRKPIIHEDRHDKNDVRNVYNADKYNNHIGNYAQQASKETVQNKPKDSKEQKKEQQKKTETQVQPKAQEVQEQIVSPYEVHFSQKQDEAKPAEKKAEDVKPMFTDKDPIHFAQAENKVEAKPIEAKPAEKKAEDVKPMFTDKDPIHFAQAEKKTETKAAEKKVEAKPVEKKTEDVKPMFVDKDPIHFAQAEKKPETKAAVKPVEKKPEAKAVDHNDLPPHDIHFAQQEKKETKTAVKPVEKVVEKKAEAKPAEKKSEDVKPMFVDKDPIHFAQAEKKAEAKPAEKKAETKSAEKNTEVKPMFTDKLPIHFAQAEKKAEAKTVEKKAEAKPAEKKAEDVKPMFVDKDPIHFAQTEKKAEAKPAEKKVEAKPVEKKSEDVKPMFVDKDPIHFAQTEKKTEAKPAEAKPAEKKAEDVKPMFVDKDPIHFAQTEKKAEAKPAEAKPVEKKPEDVKPMFVDKDPIHFAQTEKKEVAAPTSTQKVVEVIN